MGLLPDYIIASYLAAFTAAYTFSSSSILASIPISKCSITTSGGIQFISSSYSLVRTVYIRYGDCSVNMSLTISDMYCSQSSSGAAWSGVNGNYCALHTSSVSSARRRFPEDSFTILAVRLGGIV